MGVEEAARSEIEKRVDKMKRIAKDSVLPPGGEYENRRVCDGLHKHHIVFGDGQRELSEKYGLYVYLRPEVHNCSKKGVHDDAGFRRRLQEAAQRAFEAHYPELSFFEVFGINFLGERDFSHDELFRNKAKERPARKSAPHRGGEGVKNHSELFGLDYLLKLRGKRA